MKFDILFSGVGGQGVLSLAAVIAEAALDEGLYVKQSEVHGMSQRGGAVVATLRVSDRPIASALIPKGRASLLISVDPLESLRYLQYLNSESLLVTSVAPFNNIPDYPDIDQLLAQIRALPHSLLVEADLLAREAGSTRAANVVLVGAAAHKIPLREKSFHHAIAKLFGRKGQGVVEMNLRAFSLGQRAAK